MDLQLLKCYGDCGGKYPKEELIKFSNQNHCRPCAAKKEKEKQDRDTLYKTIQAIYKIPYPTGMMLKQIKDFKEQRNYTYEGMTKTLCYAVKVLRMTLNTRGGMALIPYNYDTAIKYYNELEEKRKQTNEVKSDVIRVRMSPLKHSTEEIKRKAFIPMEGLS